MRNSSRIIGASGVRTYNAVDIARLASAAGWWEIAGQTCVGAYQAKGAASQAASYTDLSGNGNTLTTGTAPTWNTSTGWTFNGSTQYLATPIYPNQDYSLFVRYANATGTAQAWPVGTYDGSASFGVVYTNGFGSRQYWNTGFRSVSGLYASATRGLANNAAYLNGASDGTLSSPGTHTFTQYLGIGARRVSAGYTQWFAGDVLAVAIYSTTISSGDASTLSTAMAAL